MVIGAGGLRPTVISGSSSGFSGVLRLRGPGIDIGRGFTADDDSACNFFAVSARLKSSFDRRGNRDLAVSGDNGGERGWADKREAVLMGFFNPRACSDVGLKPLCGSSSRFRTIKLGEMVVWEAGDGASN